MPVIHIVLFEFKPTTHLDQINEACQRMLALKTQCTYPSTQQTYVKAASGGRDISPEGQQGGFSHAFVLEFETDEQWKYYLDEDPMHQAFKKSIKGIIEKVRVVDFTPNVW